MSSHYSPRGSYQEGVQRRGNLYLCAIFYFLTMLLGAWPSDVLSSAGQRQGPTGSEAQESSPTMEVRILPPEDESRGERFLLKGSFLPGGKRATLMLTRRHDDIRDEPAFTLQWGKRLRYSNMEYHHGHIIDVCRDKDSKQDVLVTFLWNGGTCTTCERVQLLRVIPVRGDNFSMEVLALKNRSIPMPPGVEPRVESPTWKSQLNVSENAEMMERKLLQGGREVKVEACDIPPSKWWR